MTDILNAIVLGVVQGITEFLPISSSGHLEIAKFILGEEAIGKESLLTTIVLHFATALSTIIVFRKEVIEIIVRALTKSGEEQRAFVFKIIISMIPAALVGVLLEDWLDQHLTGNLILVCLALLITAALLFLADRAKTSEKGVSYWDAMWIGLAQAIAITPGISRSGATISTSVLLGIDREKAARFSFLMVVPLIFGKMLKDLLDGDFAGDQVNLLPLSIGFFAALLSGILACKWMIAIVKASKLKYFSYYCILVAGIGLFYFLS